MLQPMMRDFAARVVRPYGRPLMPYDWVCLNSNDRVCVQRENENLVNGTVDVVASDASVFWIWLDNGLGRVAVHEADNVSVWFEVKRQGLSRGQLPLPSDTAALHSPCF
jgi:hypothetical protein